MLEDRPGSLGSADICMLSGIPQFAALSEETRNALQRICQVTRYAAGQGVVHAGETAEFIGTVRAGILRMQKTLHDGRQHIVGLLVKGDMFGRVFDGPLHFDIEAATPAEVLSFRRAPFEALVSRSPDLDRAVMLNLLGELDRARDWMIVLANPRVRGRLAAFLLMLCTRLRGIATQATDGADRLQVRIPIGRADLAQLLGSRPESVSRALHALADDGLIDIIRPDLLGIRDLGLLAEEAGEHDSEEIALLSGRLPATRRLG